MRGSVNPLFAALAQARRRAAPIFTKWCELNDVSSCPAAPADVARFVADCASLGIERLWPALQDISKLHVAAGLADPTSGGVAAVAISDLAGVEPPRAWPGERQRQCRSLPYDLQVYVGTRESQRERALRRAQNEAAIAKQTLAACTRPEVRKNEESQTNANDPHSTA